MKNGEKVLGLRSKNNWIDIGRPWELLDVNEHFLKDLKTDIQGEIEEGCHNTWPGFYWKKYHN